MVKCDGCGLNPESGRIDCINCEAVYCSRCASLCNHSYVNKLPDSGIAGLAFRYQRRAGRTKEMKR